MLFAWKFIAWFAFCSCIPICLPHFSHLVLSDLFSTHISSSLSTNSLHFSWVRLHQDNNIFSNNKLWEELIAYFPWYDTGHIENNASNNFSIVACVLFTAVTFLPSRCLATIRRFLPARCLATIRGLLPSRFLSTIGYTYTHTHTDSNVIS
jgi:hypothetical protein